MQPIFDLTARTAFVSAEAAGAAGAKEMSPAKAPGKEALNGPGLPKQQRDEYTPEQEQTPSGRYWPGRDKTGRQIVFYDAPRSAEDAPGRLGGPVAADDVQQPPGAPVQPSNAPGGDAPKPDLEQNKEAGTPQNQTPQKEERCTADTGRVDREIAQLKKQKQELERRIRSETDEARLRQLQAQKAEIEQELLQKDNDAYRRQHARYTLG